MLKPAAPWHKRGFVVTQSILTHRFPNGLALVAEEMAWLESVAFAILVPGGCARDPAGKSGLASITCEMVQRGCGPRNSRQFVEDLEILGVDMSSSVSNAHASFGGAMPADKIYDAMSIFADLVRRPHLPADQLEEARLACFQEVRAVEDDLAQKVMLELRRRQYPDPFGRSSHGTVESIARITMGDIRNYFQTLYAPGGAILSVAGKFHWPRLRDHVEQLFADWQPSQLPALVETPPDRSRYHILHESNQTHIGVAYPSVAYSHPDYFQARGAVGVLSDGMSSRLFTEVREKRGLCYTVYAMSHSLLDRGSVFCYAGTSTERAQETLDVLLAELNRLAQGIEPDELRRLKAQIKSSLIMQQESSRARSASIAGDWYYLGRVRTLDEISGIIDGLTCQSINAYLAEHPPRDFTIVTLGEDKLEAPGAVS
jgi:predicted Zn-dependent peptidase